MTNRRSEDEMRFAEPFELVHERKRSQLGLIDLFYLTSLLAVVLGCHNFISQPAAVVLCGAIAVYLVLRLFPCQYGVLGGMLAFGTSVFCLPVMLGFGGLSSLSEILVCLVFPPTAYILGAIYTEFSELEG